MKNEADICEYCEAEFLPDTLEQDANDCWACEECFEHDPGDYADFLYDQLVERELGGEYV